MLDPDQMVRVRVWSKADGWGGEPWLVRVVNPDYVDAFGPSFTGEVVRGRWPGETLAFQVRHVVGLEEQ